MRAESPDRLYVDVCSIAVESGLFQFAWIGLLDPSTGRFRNMAQSSSVTDLPQLEDVLGETANMVLLDKAEVLCNDLGGVQHGQLAHRKMHAYGFQSMAGLPLRESDSVIGVFLLYCENINAFDSEVSNLLTEVADDISFSLGHMRAEQPRKHPARLANRIGRSDMREMG